MITALKFLLLTVLVGAALTLNLCLGEVSASPADIWAALAGGPLAGNGSGLSEIVWQIRLPRLVTALLVGVGLSVSGFVLQSLSRNQLADPYLTGVSSGAGLAVAVAIVAGADFQAVPLAAFAGGLTASFVVALMARSPFGLSVTRLLLSGVALTAICSGFITLLLINSANLTRSQSVFFWLAGGIGGSTWNEAATAAAYTLAGVAFVLLLSKPLRLLSLGTSAAASLGLEVARTQWLLLFAAVLMCGACVSVSGLVGFVGLIAPHIARRTFGGDERALIVASALVGGLLVLMSDLAARTLGQGQELPLGTLLSLLGGPFFLWLVVRQKAEAL